MNFKKMNIYDIIMRYKSIIRYFDFQLKKQAISNLKVFKCL